MQSIEEEFWCSFVDKHFLIVGFTERTGFVAAKLFDRFNIEYSISDIRSRDALNPLLEQLLTAPKAIFSGEQTVSQLLGIDYILLSPGVPRSIELVIEAEKRGITVYNDFDFLYELYKSKTIVAVTGTDGKTTTVTLLEHIFSPHSRVIACGNNGRPIMGEYDTILDSDIIILELSSYMLESVKHFRADYSIITNIDCDHLDRYSSFEEYKNSKFNVLKNSLSTDLFIKNIDNSYIERFSSSVNEIKVSYNQKSDVYYDNGLIVVEKDSFAFNNSKFSGVHNIENILFSSAVAVKCGLTIKQVAERVNSFVPLEHRLEPVAVKKDVEVYNDSKATTVQSVYKAIQSFDCPIVLLVGGRGKGLDFSPLNKVFSRVHTVIGYGESGESLLAQIESSSKILQKKYIKGFREAISVCWDALKSGDVFLFSPGCTSWDQFKSFQERGDFFKNSVRSLDEVDSDEI